MASCGWEVEESDAARVSSGEAGLEEPNEEKVNDAMYEDEDEEMVEVVEDEVVFVSVELVRVAFAVLLLVGGGGGGTSAYVPVGGAFCIPVAFPINSSRPRLYPLKTTS